MSIQTISLADISFNGNRGWFCRRQGETARGLRARLCGRCLDRAQVAELVIYLREGLPLAVPVLARTATGLEVLDGLERVIAAARVGRETIKAAVVTIECEADEDLFFDRYLAAEDAGEPLHKAAEHAAHAAAALQVMRAMAPLVHG